MERLTYPQREEGKRLIQSKIEMTDGEAGDVFDALKELLCSQCVFRKHLRRGSGCGD